MVTRLTRETPRLTWLLAVAALVAQPAFGQTLQRPDPIPVARMAESPAPIAGSRLVIRSGLRTPAVCRKLHRRTSNRRTRPFGCRSARLCSRWERER